MATYGKRKKALLPSFSIFQDAKVEQEQLSSKFTINYHQILLTHLQQKQVVEKQN